MRQKRNIIRKNNWLYLIPQFAVLLLISMFLEQMRVPRYWLLSLSIYFLLSGYLKIIIPKWHLKGLFYIRKGEFEGAVFAFQKSYNFFSRNSWIDKYRAFTLFSISRISYTEMALMNMIYCYERLGDKKSARNIQSKLLKEFPDNPFGHIK